MNAILLHSRASARWICIALTSGLLALGVGLPGISAMAAIQAAAPEQEQKSDGTEKCETDLSLVEMRRIQRLREGTPNGPELRRRLSSFVNSRKDRPSPTPANCFVENDFHNGLGAPLLC